jgi:hypothetical protein
MTANIIAFNNQQEKEEMGCRKWRKKRAVGATSTEPMRRRC